MPSAIIPTDVAKGTDLFHFMIARKLSVTRIAGPPGPSGISRDALTSRPASAPPSRARTPDRLHSEIGRLTSRLATVASILPGPDTPRPPLPSPGHPHRARYVATDPHTAARSAQ